MRGASILGTGAALGDVLAESADLDQKYGFHKGSIAKASCVLRRPMAEAVDQVALATKASEVALEDAALAADDLDAILHASAVPYQTIPATAPLVQRGLGLPDGAVAAYDISATCLGFLAGLQHAAAMIEAGRWRRVLVVASEHVSANLDWSTPGTAGLFGDGAGAAVVGDAPGGLEIGPITLRTLPSGYDAARLRAGGTRLGRTVAVEDMQFEMDGPALYALTRRRFGQFVRDFLESETLNVGDVDLVVPHQASPVALGLMARALKVPEDRLVNVAATQGNLVAASLPVTLDHARRSGRITRNARIMLLGTAAGVTFGAGLLRAS